MIARSVRRRVVRRRGVPWVWLHIPVISPYADRLRDRAFPERCEPVEVAGIVAWVLR